MLVIEDSLLTPVMLRSRQSRPRSLHEKNMFSPLRKHEESARPAQHLSEPPCSWPSRAEISLHGRRSSLLIWRTLR